ncbi:NAD-dependent protein lipoamidase sirtuin-4 [Homalodisca vitripennis]|nr:NAD-dependent protein lipoamidase sirtuin-4 [Homalodisca vitripennis]
MLSLIFCLLQSTDGNTTIIYRTIKHAIDYVPKHNPISEDHISTIKKFFKDNRQVLVLTGAGVSTESGIPDYRSEGVGLFARSGTKPVQYQEFLKYPKIRQRYWARNFVGWPNFSSIAPNQNHAILKHLEDRQQVQRIITQNVDNLHSKAGSRQVIELHGTAFKVVCLSCDYITSRFAFQKVLSDINQEIIAAPQAVRPDGDIDLPQLANIEKSARCVNNSWNNMSDIFKKMGQHAFGSAGQPTKRPSSPPASSVTKKVAAPAKGLFKGHVTAATVTSDQPTASVSTPRIPLLFLDSKLEELARDGLTTTFRGAHYRLKVTTVEDLRAVQRYLCSKKLPFYTHNLGRERSLKVGISGLPDTDDVELFDVLTDEGFAVNEDARLRTARGPTRSWVITLTRDSERTLTPSRLAKSTTWQACSMSGSKSLSTRSRSARRSATGAKEAEKMRPLRGKSSEDELPQSLDGEGPKATPRQKLKWPPTPATPPQQTEVPAADAAAEAAAPAQRSLQAVLAEIAAQLTALTWLFNEAVAHRPAARLLQEQIVPVDRQVIELNCSDTAHRPGGAPRGHPSDPT